MSRVAQKYEQTLEAEVQIQESVIANLTSALERASDERTELARRAKEREEQLEEMLEDLRNQLDQRQQEWANRSSSSPSAAHPPFQPHASVHQGPSSLSPEAHWEHQSRMDGEAHLGASGGPSDNRNLSEATGDEGEEEEESLALSATAASQSRLNKRQKPTSAASYGRGAAGKGCVNEDVGGLSGTLRRGPNAMRTNKATSPSGALTPTSAAASPNRRSTASPSNPRPLPQLGPLIKYQGLLSGSMRNAPHSDPVALSQTYKDLLKYQSLDPHVHEYLVNLESENKSLRKEVETLNKQLREHDSEHERVRALLQKRVSAAEDSSRTLASHAATLDSELQSMKRLYNDTADELAKTLTSTAVTAASGVGFSMQSNTGNPLGGRRASYSHLNGFGAFPTYGDAPQ